MQYPERRHRLKVCKKARIENPGELAKHSVFDKMPSSECWTATGQAAISTRWDDAKKADDANPVYRSRLVSQELNNSKREDLFASTPPLELKKLLFSLAVTESVGFVNESRQTGHKIEFIDIRRGYFLVPARRAFYVSSPPGDNQPGIAAG